MSFKLLVALLAVVSLLGAIEANTHHRHESSSKHHHSTDRNRPQMRFAADHHGGIEEMTRADSRFLRKPCLIQPSEDRKNSK